ncbi:MAG: hypothetical protein HY326_03225 [Chloroflexi bacterium]|nr:hypothetical protein [Chloroflexota bacterium]
MHRKGFSKEQQLITLLLSLMVIIMAAATYPHMSASHTQALQSLYSASASDPEVFPWDWAAVGGISAALLALVGLAWMRRHLP